VHHVHVTATNVADVTQVDKLLHGEENMMAAEAGYTGIEKCEKHNVRLVIWKSSPRRSMYEKYGKKSAL
jgi:IS5 family transposase